MKKLNKMNKKKSMSYNVYAGGGAVEGLIGQAPGIANAIIGLLNNPNNYSNQPIVNASTMRNMSSPYIGMAYGGTIDDLDEDELSQLQQFADENDMSEEDAFDQINSQQGEGSGDEVAQYGKGGWISKAVNPAHKGYCTPMTKSTCTPRRKAFAMTMKKHHGFHAMGGNADINVEGNEIVQQPGQMAMKVSGPSHEEGGVDMNVPVGTKIFSDRLEIDGKSMQQRKAARERRLGKLNSTFDKHMPTNVARNTKNRMSSNIQAEEAQDMQLQEAANKIYAPPQEQQEQMAYGGYKRMKYPYGGYEDGLDMIPTSAMDRMSPSYGVNMYPNAVDRTLNRTSPDYSVISPVAAANPVVANPTPRPIGQLGAGDYVGMAGTAFNTIAPILNTLRAKKMTAPVMNRFEGVGQRAIESNDQAQNYVAGQKANAMTDIDTSANASMIRNRNSARGVNTQRALDTITDIVRGKSRNAVGDTFSRQMTGLMGQRGALTNFQDIHEAQGQTAADTANAMNRDNYYSNMAQNLTNAGEGIQTIGRDLNAAKTNRVDANLISQLSQYGLAFDADGNLINKRR